MAQATLDAVRVGTVAELQAEGCRVVAGGRHGIAVFWHEGRPCAVDNRCPHMGFPLSRGTVCDGLLTCHWHHARFDLASGGTLDPFADDVRVYPVRVVGDEVWVEITPPAASSEHWRRRLQDSLEQQIGLVTAKAVIALLESGDPAAEVLRIGSRFGARYRQRGWGPGLTILTAMANCLPVLSPDDRVLALYHGLLHVADDCAGQPPFFELAPLPATSLPTARLKAWLRQCVEVRDQEGAERVLRTAIASATPAEVADMLFAAATDHVFLDGGHILDFLNKGFELLDHVGWAEAPTILPTLVGGLCRASRAEEQSAWRRPVDLIALMAPALAELPALAARPVDAAWGGFDALVATLLGEEPEAIVAALRQALAEGAGLGTLSQALAYAAALRMARFHTANEYSDWITVLHTFSYCNALDGALRRAPSAELARGLFHGALRLYLDRFLNLPAARLPEEAGVAVEPAPAGALLAELRDLFDREQQVGPAALLVHRYLALGHDDAPLLATLGGLLLREDAEFHSYQCFEAGLRQHGRLRARRPEAARHVLVAVARYLAAHSPTARALQQTARIALRLQRGEDLTVAPE